MEETVDNTRVHPVILGQAGFKVSSNVLHMAFASWVKGRAEATRPKLALAEKLDHFFGMRAGGAVMALLVVLVERVGAPEAAVASWFRARVLSPALVKLVFVAFPIVLALKARVTRCAPVNIGLAGGRGARQLGAVADDARSTTRRRIRKRSLRSGARYGLPGHGRSGRANRPERGMTRGAGAGRGDGNSGAVGVGERGLHKNGLVV